MHLFIELLEGLLDKFCVSQRNIRINPTFQENNIITSKKINNINNLHFQDVNTNNIITPKITGLYISAAS